MRDCALPSRPTARRRCGAVAQTPAGAPENSLFISLLSGNAVIGSGAQSGRAL